jgi:STE24 endopeptidase
VDYLQVGIMLVIVCIWFFGFGFVSRRFEWQADLFGARSITPSKEMCDRPCYYHGTAGHGSGNVHDQNENENDSSDKNTSLKNNPHHEAVCARGAEIFADALIRIASLNGIPVEAKSWRHSSISNRISLLRRFAHDPAAVVSFERTVRTIKVVLVVGTIIGTIVTSWLYWPF